MVRFSFPKLLSANKQLISYFDTDCQYLHYLSLLIYFVKHSESVGWSKSQLPCGSEWSGLFKHFAILCFLFRSEGQLLINDRLNQCMILALNRAKMFDHFWRKH